MLQCLKKLLFRPIASPGVESLYRACVIQARQRTFYADLHVPDTVDGRFDLLILHVFLVIHKLQAQSEETQQLFDILFADMDKNLREMGVSDISIPKKMKPMLAAFYGRAQSYEKALAADDAALRDVLQRNIYGATTPAPEHIDFLTRYVRQTYVDLGVQATHHLLDGHITFPAVIYD